MVLIHPGDAGGVDVQVHGEAENQQLNQRRQEQHAAHARLAQGLNEFLANDASKPLSHIHATFCRSFRDRQEKHQRPVDAQQQEIEPQNLGADAFQETPFEISMK